MFGECRTKEEAKKLYRKLANYLHPDRGGDSELMILLTESYKKCLYFLDGIRKEEHQYATYEPDEKFPEAFEDVVDGDAIADVLLCSIIYDIRIYAHHHKKFDLSFTNSVEEFLEEKGYMTASQYNSLRKIYKSFHMEEWLEKYEAEKH